MESRGCVSNVGLGDADDASGDLCVDLIEHNVFVGMNIVSLNIGCGYHW